MNILFLTYCALFSTYFIMIRQLLFVTMIRKNSLLLKTFQYRIYLTDREKANDILDKIIRKISNFKIYKIADIKIHKAGFDGKYCTIKYIFLLYILPVIIFILSSISNKELTKALVGSLAVFVGVSLYVREKINKISFQFEKHAWRIYRYLHNQISSGIKITDAVTTVYETVNDPEIKKVLVKFSAAFQLTMNIQESLDEIASKFGGNEAATLCMAVREGVKTGDSGDMLKRQEDVMFNKYFNRIEAETERSRTMCIFSALMFCSILVIMASVPVIMDLLDALDSIFIV